MTRALVLASVLLATVACGAATSPAAHSVGQITLAVSGGLTGWSRELVIDPGGTAQLNVTRGPTPASGPHAVPAQTLERLRSAVSDPAFAHLKPEYPAPAGSADVQAYTVTAEIDGRQLQTTTYDAAAPPQILSEVLGLLIGVMNSFDQSAAATCSTGYSSTNPTIRLTNADNGRAVTAKVCDSIWIMITTPQAFVGPSPGWQFPQSSDTSVLEVVPLPLPHPVDGVEAVYLAKHTGRATLTAENGVSNCPPNAMCLAPERWSVTVAVIP